MKYIIATLLCLTFTQTTFAAETRPNIVVILSDDQGWGDLSVHGNTNLKTPHIDSLARDGAMFDRFYVCPVCSPTRAEFLTGRYHPRGGVYGVTSGGERLNLDVKTIGDHFKAAGYATGAFGKWHNGMQYPYHPNGRGFDEYYGFCSGHWGNYFDPVLEHNGKLVRGKGFIIDDLTSHAISFIEKNKDRPFLCYIPLNTPHSPFHVPDRFYNKFKDAKLPMRNRFADKEQIDRTRAALAMCENIDWNVGRVLKKLDDLKLSENTIVVYFSDNGPNTWRWNGGMAGKKGSTDEGGVRVPCFIRWKGHIQPKTKIKQIAGGFDLLPTFAAIANVPITGDKKLDGMSLKPLLFGAKMQPANRMIFSLWARKVSVRTQKYRLNFRGKLFDMEADPGQNKDVSKQHPQLTAKLTKAVADWKAEMFPLMKKKDRPFTVGYPQFPITHLPARDARPHGNVQRSARAPNCSCMTNGISTKDKITWNVEINKTGKYEAVLYYTCKKENVGTTIELELNGSKIQKKITEAHDPPLYGDKEDRASRGSESLVKIFRPLTLGTFELKKRRGDLTLRAINIPGKGVVDVRYVRLELLK